MYCCHDTACTFANIWSAPSVHCVRLLFIVITVNECCTSSPVHAHNGTANCTVGHDCEALLLLGQNVFNANSVEKTSFPFPMTHGIQIKYMVCANFSSTQVIHKKYQIIKQFFAQDICSPFTLPYVHKYMFQ
jgi:hypothetical protein